LTEYRETENGGRDPQAKEQLRRLLQLGRRLSPRLNKDLIGKAFWTAQHAHRDQKRRSGEPYFGHVLAVAETCAELNLGSNAIAAALLHDTVEDTGLSLEILRQEFNPGVARLVDGVSKISQLHFESREKQQALNFRKLLLHMSKDIRILLIKLADRMHNMSTLNHLSREAQIRIARETMDIYAPLANRLGIGRLKWQLEDLSFKYLEPKHYDEMAGALGMRREMRDEFIGKMRDRIQQTMDDNHIECAVQGRAKHLYSAYQKMVDQRLTVEELYDLLAFRIITETVADTYHALGVIHTLFKSLPTRFKDYIATPKRNGYQSLHTAVICDDGQIFEVQIRTYQMHEVAEFGIASHWRYKDGFEDEKGVKGERDLDFLRNFLEELKDGEWSDDPSEFMAHLKINLFQEGIFVFTPRGDLHILPEGSTPLDFAYAIHTEVGDTCIGARVDKKLVPLRRQLESGDVVEILTRKNAHPSRDWLNYVKTSKAVSKIKRRLRESERDQSISLGRELLEREFKQNRKPYPDDEQLASIAEAFGMDRPEGMVEGVGRGTLAGASIFNRLYPPKQPEPDFIIEEGETIAPPPKDSVSHGVRVEGHGNLMIRFAGCCEPVPGDRIVGIVTRGRGVSIHRQDCINLIDNPLMDDRSVEVTWDVGEREKFQVSLLVLATDRPNLLLDVTGNIAKTGTNITNGTFERVEKELNNRFLFTLEVKDLDQLDKVIDEIRKVRGVQEVRRT
jgi:GTP diphosphokinase / guanosine-3',5'-bis(diphosphate) 3'-diphosphatase